jgi:hypothetical protein
MLLTAPEAIELAALALCRAAAARFSDGYAWLSLDHRRRRAAVDQALRRRWRPNSLFDDRHYLENARTSDERVDAVADLHLRRRFGRGAVHTYVAATAGGSRVRPALVDPDGP